MKHLLSALIFATRLVDALPTGRYLGSDPNGPAHSHASDDIFVDDSLQKLWDAAPSSTFPSPPRMPAPQFDLEDQSALSITEPAPKRLKKHHTVDSPPRDHTDTPVGFDSHTPSTHAGPSRTPSSYHLGSHEQASVPIHGKVPPTMSPPTNLKPWTLPILGLRVTPEAHPQEVHKALRGVHDRYSPKGNQLPRHRTSILRMAVASVADGCTNNAQYMDCIKEKYGAHLAAKHKTVLRNIIKESLDNKVANSLRTPMEGSQHIVPHPQSADNNDKWFENHRTTQKEQIELSLPPADRKEPQVEHGDDLRYRELIKHLDPFQLSCHEYIKHGYRPLEEDPDRWEKSIPRKAMISHLCSKGASKAMIDHFRKTHHTILQSVSLSGKGCPVAP